MKVRATQNGTYGGWYRTGPSENGDGTWTPGEVFEINANPHTLNDEHGKPMQEFRATGKIDEKGQPEYIPVWEMDLKTNKSKLDKNGQPIPKLRLVTDYSPEWMEPVNEDATITHPERRQPMGVLKEYQPKVMPQAPVVGAMKVALPPEVAALVGPKAESPL